MGIKINFVLVAVFLVFLAGCGMKGDEGREGAVTFPAEGWEKEKEEKEKEVFEVLPIVAVDEEYVFEEGEFSFGELHIAVPQELWEETQVKNVALSDGSRGACMWSEKYICPVEIQFFHYKAAWQQEPMHMHGLAYALMELIGTDSISCRNVNRYTSQSELSFTAEDDLWYYYVLVRGEDIYLVKDMDTYINFGFRSFYFDDFVTWGEAGRAVTVNGDASVGYARGKEPDGNVFFLIQKKDGITVYKNSMEKIDQTLLIGEDKSPDVAFEKDINFDGYPDLCGYRDYYLYHPESESFEKVETDIDVNLSYHTYFFEEEGAIWRGENEYDEETWHRSAYKEQLWQWEGYEPVLVRECVAEFGEKDVTICAREVQTGKELFAAVIPNEEYNGNSAELKALYVQFYAGYVPKEVYYLEHSAAGDISYVPDGLIDLLSEAMLDNTEPETLEAMVIDRELSDEELWETASVNRGIGSVIMAIAPGWHGDAVAVSGDGDNDGIEDILVEIYGGGSGGFTEFAFFKGRPDGTFAYTGSYSHFREEFALICYEGKNYLCRTTYDYNKKIYNGLDLFYYEDGRRKESISLYFVPETYQVQVKAYASEAYRAYAEAYFTAEDCMEASDRINQGEGFIGSAETKGEMEGYFCDLDNDGEAENYSRYIWYPSNMRRYGLCFQCEDVPVADEAIYKSGQDGFPVIFWVEEADGENIMNVLYQTTGLYDFHIAGFVIGEENYQQVYDIVCLAKCTVAANRYFIYEGEE